MTRSTWDIIDRGRVPKDAPEIDYDCSQCGHTARLPILGTPIAQIGSGGVIFDPGDHDIPETIRCRNCRRIFEKG